MLIAEILILIHFLNEEYQLNSSQFPKRNENINIVSVSHYHTCKSASNLNRIR